MLRQQLWNEINDKYSDFLFGLYERWQSEKEYEDIEEYLKVVQKSVPCTYQMTKRPFGFKCKCDDGNMKVDIKLKGNYLKLFGSNIK